jgi:crossover junction endodeoxyribonuclease RusA
MSTLSLTVHGLPAPQGSKSAVRGKDGRVRLLEGSTTSARQRHRAWRDLVAQGAREAWGDRDPLDCPVQVHIRFFMPRPKSARKALVWAAKKPDLDKLCRSVLDSLTDAGVLRDDSRVVQLHAEKSLAFVGQTTGATVIVTPVEEAV